MAPAPRETLDCSVPNENVREAVRLALAEDVGSGDATTLSVVPPQANGRAVLRAREALVVCGLAFFEEAMRQVDPEIVVEPNQEEGSEAEPGAIVATITGALASILTGERVALNFVQRLSGVATLTRRYVQAVAGTGAGIYDTRKTTPGWRAFERYAVRVGGGRNHRFGLDDMILIKDNHLASLPDDGIDPVARAIYLARGRFPHLRVQVEADRPEQAIAAAEAGADLVLLDNMSPDTMREVVAAIGERSETEASGGIQLNTVAEVARSGVDRISVGALTHSAPSVDFGLDID